MKTEDFYRKWIDRNAFETTKQTGRQGNHAFIGPVYYYNNTPSHRIVWHRNGKRFGILIGYHTGTFEKARYNLTVPDIGVFSRFEGDMLPDEELHPRVQWLMVNEIKEYVDQILPAKSNEDCANSKMQESYMKSFNALVGRYDSYNAFFDLGWTGIPPSFMDRAKAMIATKGAEWNDPNAVTKRQRAKAKRAAEKALGLDKKKAA